MSEKTVRMYRSTEGSKILMMAVCDGRIKVARYQQDDPWLTPEGFGVFDRWATCASHYYGVLLLSAELIWTTE